MNPEQRKIVKQAVDAAFGYDARIKCRAGSMCESSLIDFSVDVDIPLDSGSVKLTFYRIKSSSRAALNDVSALLGSMPRDGAIPVVLAAPLSPDKQELLRKNNQPFIDDAGNAWLRSSGVHIDIRGRKLQKDHITQRKSENVFSDKATLILRILFEYGPMGVRDISRLASGEGFPLSAGYVSKTVASLGGQGYAVKRSDDAIALRRKRDLLDDWVSFYRKLKQGETRSYFLPALDVDGLASEVGRATARYAALSDRAGASLVDSFAAFDSVMLLANESDAASRMLISLGAKEVERGANIELMQPRYKVSAFFGAREIEGCRVVSDLQLYLDLMRQPKRGLEAAEHLMQKRLAKMLTEEGDDVE